MHVTVLANLDHAGAAPDPVVPQIQAALGGDTDVLGVTDDLAYMVDQLKALGPDLIFNVAEEFGRAKHGDILIPAVLDLMRIPHTGGSAQDMALQSDKVVAKLLMKTEGIRTTNFAVFTRDRQPKILAEPLRFPLFVKPVGGEASEGIDAASFCETREELSAKVRSIHENLKMDALVESFIDGREFYAGVLGNENPEALPIVEMVFAPMPDGKPAAMTAAAKFKKGSAEYAATNPEIAQIDDALTKRIQRIALDACKALHVTDYGRVDMRMDAEGRVYVIEVNASPFLIRGGEYAMAADAGGYPYEDLIKKIVGLAMKRQPGREPKQGN